MGPKAGTWHQALPVWRAPESHGTYVMSSLLTVRIDDLTFVRGGTPPTDPFHPEYVATIAIRVVRATRSADQLPTGVSTRPVIDDGTSR